MSGRTKFWLLALIVVAAGLDRWVKHLVETGMALGERIDLLPFFALLRAHNYGIAFSMLSSFGGIGLIALMIVVIGFVSWLALGTRDDQTFARLGYALILGGALGNLVDRVTLGYVIDYFLFFTPSWSFAIFNLADAFITVGAGLVILDECLAWRRARAKSSEESP